MATPSELGLRAREGAGAAVKRKLQPLTDLGEIYRSVLPPIAEFGSSFLFGRGSEPAPAPKVATPPPDALRPAVGNPTVVKPWDEEATSFMANSLPEISSRARSAELKQGGFTEFAPGQGYKGPALKGGGTVSMMTSPENVDRVTFPSQIEDLQREQILQDPLGLRRAEADARMKQNPVDVRKVDIVDGLAELEQGLAQRVQAGEMTPQEAQQRLAVGKARAKEFLDGLRSGYPPAGMDLPPLNGPVG